MENLTVSLISPIYLASIGIVFIVLEMLAFSFVFFWFGVAFLLIAGLSLFNIFPDGLWQLGSIALSAMLMLLFLRTKAFELFLKSKEERNDNFFNESGIGKIKHGKVSYKATYWEMSSEGKETFEEDEKVVVLRAEKGVAFIKKLD